MDYLYEDRGRMSLKTRIVISCLVTILVPLVLTSVAFFFLIRMPAQAPHSWIWQFVIFVVVVLALTSLAMSFWIYKGVERPLHEIKRATRKIRDGDLDFSIETGEGVREVSELAEDFEQMRVRLKESAEEKIVFDRESKELISNISHDLKTPLTAIKGYALGLTEGVADTPEKVAQYIQTIYNKANEMDSLIDELTLYSKIDTNRIPYSFARIPIRAYFEDCAEELRMDLAEQGIRFTYSDQLREDALIIADAEQLKRAINNIVGNSVKYMDKEDGRIELRLLDVGELVQVEIEDNGKGIAKEDLMRIFDRFYRTDTSRTSRVGGSGIGLSIVRKIIEDHEGKVWATSKEGVGTVIYLSLRKYQEEQHEQNTDH